MWVCDVEPNIAILSVGLYQCDKCGGKLIAFPSGTQKQSTIGDFRYCPYCGKDHKKYSNYEEND